jgi:hypothetical protein
MLAQSFAAGSDSGAAIDSRCARAEAATTSIQFLDSAHEPPRRTKRTRSGRVTEASCPSGLPGAKQLEERLAVPVASCVRGI